MQKLLYFIGVIASLMSCNTRETKATEKKKYDPEIERQAERYVDSIVKKAEHDALFDTVGLSRAPIKVLSSRLVKREYSNYRDIGITFKNVSGKKIEAMKFRWYGQDAFGEPADMGILSNGFGGGFDDDPLGAGKTRTSQWSILSKDAKKIVLAWPSEVVFSDGTKWEIGH